MEKRPGRRPAMYYYIEPGGDQNERGGFYIELKRVNLIRSTEAAEMRKLRRKSSVERWLQWGRSTEAAEIWQIPAWLRVVILASMGPQL